MMADSLAVSGGNSIKFQSPGLKLCVPLRIGLPLIFTQMITFQIYTKLRRRHYNMKMRGKQSFKTAKSAGKDE